MRVLAAGAPSRHSGRKIACCAACRHLADSGWSSRRDRALQRPAPLHQLRPEHNFNVEDLGKFDHQQGAAAESDGADGGADDSSAVVYCERADWERCASRRAAVRLVQAGDGPGQEAASADRKTIGTQRRWTLSSMTSSVEEGTSGTEMRRGRLSLARGQHGARRGPNARDGSGPYNLGDRAPVLSRPTHASSPGAD